MEITLEASRLLEKCRDCERGFRASNIGEFNCVLCGNGPAPSIPWEAEGKPKPETEEQIAAALDGLRARCERHLRRELSVDVGTAGGSLHMRVSRHEAALYAASARLPHNPTQQDFGKALRLLADALENVEMKEST